MVTSKHTYSAMDRFALSLFNTKIMWSFFTFLNLFAIGYMAIQEFVAFDPYPFTFLNLILAIFVAEMDIIIVIAQIVSGYKTEAQSDLLIQLMRQNDTRADLMLDLAKNSITIMRELDQSARREVERDLELQSALTRVSMDIDIIGRSQQELFKLIRGDSNE